MSRKLAFKLPLNSFTLRVVTLCLVPTIASHCPSHVSSKIQECVRPVAEYAKLINNNDQGPRNAGTSEIGNAFSLPNMGRRVFNGLCKSVVTECSIQRVASPSRYLAFMESAECLMELDRKPEVKKCHDETLVEIETANSETGIAMAEKLDRMCGALNFFAGCVKSPIKHECGSSAWQVIYRVLKDTTNTLMPGCHFTGASTRLLSSEVEGKAPPSTVTQPILTTTEPTSTTTTTVSPVKDYARFPNEEAVAQSRKGLSKNIVSEELAQINSVGSLLSLSILLFVLTIFSF
ncbi:unnamed protein product [Haemonchus placei]|uniref:DUF19 domain-containing protein n=1 Tax=Haemonchus placei TaxID=6290 RepID=A0A3P7WZN1_HAEPC|nr:unnamed protein product [Haemonchus placei]